MSKSIKTSKTHSLLSFVWNVHHGGFIHFFMSDRLLIYSKLISSSKFGIYIYYKGNDLIHLIWRIKYETYVRLKMHYTCIFITFVFWVLLVFRVISICFFVLRCILASPISLCIFSSLCFCVICCWLKVKN